MVVDLADVLELVGATTPESVGALECALEHYERKGNIVSAKKVRERLASPGRVPGMRSNDRVGF